jgi:hypothetical protein
MVDKIEEASWDWNPIWQMLSSNQQILKKMLELPWMPSKGKVDMFSDIPLPIKISITYNDNYLIL